MIRKLGNSSEAEQRTVNAPVVGSTPASPANRPKPALDPLEEARLDRYYAWLRARMIESRQLTPQSCDPTYSSPTQIKAWRDRLIKHGLLTPAKHGLITTTRKLDA